jgi:hypothetical protein
VYPTFWHEFFLKYIVRVFKKIRYVSGKEILSQTKTFECFVLFKEGRISTKVILVPATAATTTTSHCANSYVFVTECVVTVNNLFYFDILKQSLMEIARKMEVRFVDVALWLCTGSLSTSHKEKLFNKHSISLVPHPPHSLDLVSSAFCFYNWKLPKEFRLYKARDHPSCGMGNKPPWKKSIRGASRQRTAEITVFNEEENILNRIKKMLSNRILVCPHICSLVQNEYFWILSFQLEACSVNWQTYY